MATVIPLPVDYIVFETSYTARIPDKKEQLMEALHEREVDSRPLYIHDTLWGNGRVLLTEAISAELDELQRATSAILGQHESGTIAFKTNSFQQIFVLKDILYDLHYCHMFFIENIQYAEATILGRTVKLAVVTVDAESG